MMDLSVLINGPATLLTRSIRKAISIGRQPGNTRFTRENTWFRIVWDRAKHMSLSVQFSLSLHIDKRRGTRHSPDYEAKPSKKIAVRVYYYLCNAQLSRQQR